jgi:hypothetical protein
VIANKSVIVNILTPEQYNSVVNLCQNVQGPEGLFLLESFLNKIFFICEEDFDLYEEVIAALGI